MSFPLTCTPSLSNTLEILASNELLGIEVSIPTTSKHSSLEYWALAEHCHSVLIRRFTSFSLTSFTTATSASTIFICVTRSLISNVSYFILEFISDSSNKTSLIRSGLFKPFHVASMSTIAMKLFQKTKKKLTS